MKGAILLRYNPAEHLGGTEVFARDFIESLAKDRRVEELHVVWGGDGTRAFGLDNVMVHGLAVPGLPSLGSGIYLSKLLVRTGGLLNGSLDFILAMGSLPASAYLYPRRGTRPLLLTYAIDAMAVEFRERARVSRAEGSKGVPWSHRVAFLLAEQIAMERSDVIIATSRRTASDLQHHYDIPASKLRAAYFAVRDDFAQGVPVADPAIPTFLHIATDPQRKGTYYLLQAAHEILSTGRDFRIIIIGTRDPFHMAVAKSLHLEERVEFRGWLGGQRLQWTRSASASGDLLGAYAGCTALAVPSVSEGFCLPVVEAAMLGKPAIASDAGSLPELIQDGRDGLIVPAGDPWGLAEAMVRVIDDPTLAPRLGRNARARSHEFTFGVRTPAFMDLLEGLLGRE